MRELYGFGKIAQSDEAHPLSIRQLIETLEKEYSISAHRVTIYEDAVPQPEDYDLTRHLNTSFGMFVRAPQRVELICDNSVMDYIVDRFGDEVETAPLDENTFQTSVDVAVSKPFLGWVFGFNGKIKIAGPEDVKKEYEAMLGRAAANISDSIGTTQNAVVCLRKLTGPVREGHRILWA